jgi:hypothetical protein
MGRATAVIIGLGTLLCCGSFVLAVPTLQVYLEGSDYDSTTEGWFIEHHDPAPLRLWVVARTPVNDVKLSIAYGAGSDATLSLVGSTTSGLGGFEDPSVAASPVHLRTVTNGSVPTLGDGSDLPNHGIYGPETEWQEFMLGDFTRTDSRIADFIYSFPAPGHEWGQINVYEVRSSGCHWLHFDAYDHIAASNHAKSVFAPFSHDGDVSSPEPVTALLFLLAGGVPILLSRRRR